MSSIGACENTLPQAEMAFLTLVAHDVTRYLFRSLEVLFELIQPIVIEATHALPSQRFQVRIKHEELKVHKCNHCKSQKWFHEFLRTMCEHSIQMTRMLLAVVTG